MPPKSKKKPGKKPQLAKMPGGYTKAVNLCPNKLTVAGVSSYGRLKKYTGDGSLDRDHIPSKAALKKRADYLAKQAGRDVTDQEYRRIENAGLAVVIKSTVHAAGRTYGNRNNVLQILKDSKNLNLAARLDHSAYRKNKVAQGILRAIEALILTNKEYDAVLKRILGIK
jgi:hypothetical protein